MYWQFRLSGVGSNPNVFIGVTDHNFRVNDVLVKQDRVWCINLASGDILGHRKWRQYYEIDDSDSDEESKIEEDANQTQFKKVESSKSFVDGSVIGVLVDQKRGNLSFFKDGEDLGVAFTSIDLCKHQLYPFIHLQ